MLIKVTNYCSMGCSHCMENSTVAGEHMTADVFVKALILAEKLERQAWLAGIPPLVLISGGEATEHPQIVTILELVIKLGFYPVLITNGMWLDDPVLRASILRPTWNNLSIQVTNDPKYYPKKPSDIPEDKRIVFVPALTAMIPLGRFKAKQDATKLRNAPTSFNLRSLTRSFGDVRKAITLMRARAIAGLSGHCSPSISSDGSLHAGETNSCFNIGTVDSTPEQITKALIDMQCNKCGLVDNLTQNQKVAIGESSIYAP